MKELQFSTKVLHAKPNKDDPHRSIRYPIYATAAYDYASSQDIEDAFTSKKIAHSYSRITNPTVEFFEKKINILEGGVATVAMASGMAAITNTIFNLVSSGENIVASKYLFGNTYSFFKNTLANLGIEVRFVDHSDFEQVDSAFDDKTKLLFVETVANPQIIVADLSKLADIAHNNDAIFVVDSTLTTPYLVHAKDHNVDVVIHSTTKYISGGGTSVGGVVTDLGSADWTKFSILSKFHHLGNMAFTARLRKEVYRNMGSALSPNTAYLHSLGLETLALRLRQSSQSALKVSQYLQEHDSVKTVNYAGLINDKYHSVASQSFTKKLFGGLLSFELADKETSYKFMDKLEIIRRATNLNDNTSLIIHPASTIYSEFDAETRNDLDVSDGLVRLSVGLEDAEDLIADLEQALGS
ncbi:MAG: O-acetylhomoserine aminocarboxypropyltransferase/cysteine synthase [Gammaproteobacteria bacterium]|nr:MAG: O-acetylhomoserine aminocarboxypropyltransferase/cysteine synthase [Gammaproteobacteria bacterium]